MGEQVPRALTLSSRPGRRHTAPADGPVEHAPVRPHVSAAPRSQHRRLTPTSTAPRIIRCSMGTPRSSLARFRVTTAVPSIPTTRCLRSFTRYQAPSSRTLTCPAGTVLGRFGHPGGAYLAPDGSPIRPAVFAAGECSETLLSVCGRGSQAFTASFFHLSNPKWRGRFS